MEEYLRLMDEVIYCRRICQVADCKRCEEILVRLDEIEKEEKAKKE